METPWSYKFIAPRRNTKMAQYYRTMQRHLTSDIDSKIAFLPIPYLFDAPYSAWTTGGINVTYNTSLKNVHLMGYNSVADNTGLSSFV